MFEKSHIGRKITYKSIDGISLTGILSIPPNPKYFALMMHGITVDKDEWQGFYRDMAYELFKHRIATLRFDFRGHGESGGSSLDISIVGDILDIKASIKQIRLRWSNQLIFIATSFGAGPAILTASQIKEEVKSLILIAPVIDYKATFLQPKTEWAKASFNEEAFRELSKKGYLLLDEYYKLSPKLIEEFRLIKPYVALDSLNMPILLIHGEKDSMVPFEVSKQCAKRKRKLKFIPLPGADHGYVDAEDETGEAPKSLKNKMKIFREIIKFINEGG